MIIYQEYAPRPALRPYLSCLWSCSVRASAAPLTHRVLPDNGLDIIWQDRSGHSFAVGMMQSSIDVVLPALVQTVAVRFKPGAAAHFFDVPLTELTDRHAGLGELWGRGCAERIADGLWTDALPDRQRLDLLQDQLLARLPAHRPGRAHTLVAGAVAAIEGSGGLLRIADLAATLGVSRQHLAATFGARVGLAPKMFARVCRFQRAAERLKALPASEPDWARLALEHGYFDQSHLIHDFREFAATSPDAFLAARKAR